MNREGPLVSVYLTTKNRKELLTQAINSVRGQTFRNFELIVVDDGSEDGTDKLLLRLEREGMLRAIINKTSYGACQSRNSAIDVAQGKFLTGLDDDDIFEPNRLGEFVSFWRESSEQGSIAGLFDSVLVNRPSGLNVMRTFPVVTDDMLRTSNLVGNQVFAPKRHFLGAGLFDVEMPAWQDWDLWVRMSKKYGNFINIMKATYRINPSQEFLGGRISAGREEVLRSAGELFIRKHLEETQASRCVAIEALLNYRQVVPHLEEILLLLRCGKFRAGLRAVRKRIAFSVRSPFPCGLAYNSRRPG